MLAARDGTELAQISDGTALKIFPCFRPGGVLAMGLALIQTCISIPRVTRTIEDAYGVPPQREMFSHGSHQKP